MNVITSNSAYESIKNRIQNLKENNPRQWGRMNINEMLLHCIEALRAIIGEVTIPDQSNFLMRTIGKKFVLSDLKFPRNTPTSPKLVTTANTFTSEEFEQNKQTLLTYIDKLKNASESQVTVHPAFGKMTKLQYGKMVYKHLDHHLRQFGA
jgi:hypothetical protein